MTRRGSPFEVLRIFLQLGLTSFGGPVAHLGYFRREFVERRAWLLADDYAGLLALCQFLPGPASSQVGFAIGLKRAGWAGGAAAWLGFTLPSAVLMAALAIELPHLVAAPLLRAALHGLGLAAVAIVAQAVWTLARQLCPDTPRRAIALLAAAVLLQMPGTPGQMLVIAIGLLAGRFTISEPARVSSHIVPLARRHGAPLLCLLLFAILLVGAFALPAHGLGGLVGAFYRTGALVFGGGHVVLPLLRDAFVTPGLIGPQTFLDGYGAAQAMPGPLFTVATFLGVAIGGGWLGGLLATVAIFLPGLLLVAAALPYWDRLQANASLRAALAGVNAAVVGLLGAAFINLVTISAISQVLDAPIALFGMLLLFVVKLRPLSVVGVCAGASVAARLAGLG
jgi:chromate transporter